MCYAKHTAQDFSSMALILVSFAFFKDFNNGDKVTPVNIEDGVEAGLVEMLEES